MGREGLEGWSMTEGPEQVGLTMKSDLRTDLEEVQGGQRKNTAGRGNK